MTKKILGREAFLSASKNLKREIVDIPELGGSIYIRELSGKRLLEYNERIEKLQKDNPELTPSSSLELMALMVSLTACDKEGNLIFTEADVKELLEANISVLVRLSTKALEVSGLGKVSQEVTAKLKKAQKDSSIIS